MVEFGACPRCKGDMNLNRDMYGEYKECLQCGYSVDVQPKPRKSFNWAKTREKPGRKRKAA